MRALTHEQLSVVHADCVEFAWTADDTAVHVYGVGALLRALRRQGEWVVSVDRGAVYAMFIVPGWGRNWSVLRGHPGDADDVTLAFDARTGDVRGTPGPASYPESHVPSETFDFGVRMLARFVELLPAHPDVDRALGLATVMALQAWAQARAGRAANMSATT